MPNRHNATPPKSLGKYDRTSQTPRVAGSHPVRQQSVVSRYWQSIPTIGVFALPVILVVITANVPDHLKYPPPKGHSVPPILWVFWFLVVLLMACCFVEWKRKSAAEIAAHDRLISREFLQDYTHVLSQIAKTVQLLNAPDADVKKMERAIRSILRFIVKVVVQYDAPEYRHPDDVDDEEQKDERIAKLCVKANVMLPESIRSQDPTTYKGLVGLNGLRGLGAYHCLLRLAYWGDTTNLTADLRLPVEPYAERLHLMPWAPKAFALGTVQVVSDIRDTVKLREAMSDCPWVVQAQQLKYFQDCRDFRSFASIPIKMGGVAMGVLNIQSMEVGLFGETDTDVDSQNHRAFVLGLLAPASAMLAIVLSKLIEFQGITLPGPPEPSE